MTPNLCHLSKYLRDHSCVVDRPDANTLRVELPADIGADGGFLVAALQVPDAEDYIFQVLYVFPFPKTELSPDLDALIQLLNKTSLLPGFGFDAVTGELFHRYGGVWNAGIQAADILLILEYLSQQAAGAAWMFSQLLSGEQTVDELVAQGRDLIEE